jgi:hypothetical protein
MEAAGLSETFMLFCWNTWHHIPEDRSLKWIYLLFSRHYMQQYVFAGSQILSTVSASFLSL